MKETIRNRISESRRALIAAGIVLAAGLLTLLAVLLQVPVLSFIKDLFMLKYLPSLEGSVNIGILFLFGLLTSVHCVGMCGGLVLSQTALVSSGELEAGKRNPLIPAFLYNLGRILSYSIAGAVIGGLGQTFSLSGFFKGLIPVVGGLFMVIMAINLLGIFPALRRLNFSLPADFLKKIKIYDKKHKRSPLVLGLLTALMPCGPMQIVQIYSLSTKSALAGAAAMLFFALGTVPGLFGFGVLGSLFTKNSTKVIQRISAVLVAILGAVMISRGLALAGVSVLPSFSQGKYTESEITGNVQTVTTVIGTDSYPAIQVTEGIPVKWTIRVSADNLNDCNREIIVPEYNLDITLDTGDTVVSFVPEESGEFVYTCWMGMIKSSILVTDTNGTGDQAGSLEQDETDPVTRETGSPPTAATDPCCTAGSPAGSLTGSSDKGSTTGVSGSGTSDSSAGKVPAAITPAASHSAAASSAQVNSSGPSAGEPAGTETTAPSAASSEHSANPGQEVSLTGYLIDVDCIPLYPDPAKETRTCLLMKSCAASGYGILTTDASGAEIFYLFDGDFASADGTSQGSGGQSAAYNFIGDNVLDKNVRVTVKGTLTGASYTAPDQTSCGIFTVADIFKS